MLSEYFLIELPATSEIAQGPEDSSSFEVVCTLDSVLSYKIDCSSRVINDFLPLRSKTMSSPSTVFLQIIDEAIVESVFTALPKLYLMEKDTVAAPKRW